MNGFSLIEVLIAMMILSFLSLSSTTYFISMKRLSQQGFFDSKQVIEQFSLKERHRCAAE